MKKAQIIEILKDRNGNYYVQAGEYKVRITDGTRHDGTTIGDFFPVAKINSDRLEQQSDVSEHDLLEWPCQQLLGGTGAAIYSNVDGMCKHPECHPRNDESHHPLKKKEGNTKHGLKGSPPYKLWVNIKSRCYNENYADYALYGAKGIVIWDEWLNDPERFCKYIVLLPNAFKKGYSLDRENTYGDYVPGNLRWATAIIQSRNRRKQNNNTSGYVGVQFKNDRYISRIRVSGEHIHIGSFDTPENAAKARNDYILTNNLKGFPIQEISQPISEERIEEIAVKLRYEMQAIEYARQQGGMSESDLKTLWNDLSSLVSEIDKLTALKELNKR